MRRLRILKMTVRLFKLFAGVCVRRQLISAVKTATRNKHKPLNSYISLDKNAYDSESDSAFIDSISDKSPQNPRVYRDR